MPMALEVLLLQLQQQMEAELQIHVSVRVVNPVTGLYVEPDTVRLAYW